MLIQVHWKFIRGKSDRKWDLQRVLYAYLTSDCQEILYIGKAYQSTVRGRWCYSAKKGFWNDLENERGITNHIAMVGVIYLPQGLKISEQLVSDTESLLIKRISPWGNIQSTTSRISRPGLRVKCVGCWRGWKPEYQDVG